MTDARRRRDEPAPAHAGFDPAMRVDWLDPAELAGDLPGRLGMTFLPGKRGSSSRYPGHTYRRDAADDLGELRRQGARTLVILVEDAELVRWSDPDLVALGELADLRVERFPIPDGGAPQPAVMARIQALIRRRRATGDVVVACMGGVGRTGMVAACALVEAGSLASAAIARVRAVRHPTAVETEVQERLVHAWQARREALSG